MATDESTSCKITNNSGKDMIIAAALSNEVKASQGAVTTFNRQIELLTLAGGGTVLKNGLTDAVRLDQSYTSGSGQDGLVKSYDLVGSDSTWLYPLAHLNVSLNGSTGYQSQTIAPENIKAMNQAISFYQTIAVYPDSQLANDYMKTLGSVKAAALARANGSSDSARSVADAIENTVRDFFKTTREYTDVTLQHVVAVNNYYANFPFVWAQYKDSLTYYLYGCDGENAFFAGTLSLQKSGPADLLKANGGYTCLFVPAANPADTSKTDTDPSKAVTLTYTNGLFVDDATSTTPKIALKGSFLLKQFFTTKEGDTQVITVVAGRCNGLRCIGFDVPQPTRAQHTKRLPEAASPIENYWNALIYPKSQLDMLISILTFVGAAAFIAINAYTIYKVYKWVKARREAAKALSEDDLNNNWEHMDESSGEESELFFGEYAGDGQGWKKVDFTKVREELAFDRLQMIKGKLVEGLEAQGRSLEGILEFFRLMRAADVAEAQVASAQIEKSIDALNEASPANLKEVVAREFQGFTDRHPRISKVLTNVSKVISADAKEMVETNLERSAEVIDNVKDMQQEDETEYEEDEPVIEKPVWPWE